MADDRFCGTDHAAKSLERAQSPSTLNAASSMESASMKDEMLGMGDIVLGAPMLQLMDMIPGTAPLVPDNIQVFIHFKHAKSSIDQSGISKLMNEIWDSCLPCVLKEVSSSQTKY